MSKQIRLNAFDMNCVGHQSPGLWAHPRDRADRYKDLDYCGFSCGYETVIAEKEARKTAALNNVR